MLYIVGAIIVILIAWPIVWPKVKIWWNQLFTPSGLTYGANGQPYTPQGDPVPPENVKAMQLARQFYETFEGTDFTHGDHLELMQQFVKMSDPDLVNVYVAFNTLYSRTTQGTMRDMLIQENLAVADLFTGYRKKLIERFNKLNLS